VVRAREGSGAGQRACRRGQWVLAASGFAEFSDENQSSKSQVLRKRCERVTCGASWAYVGGDAETQEGEFAASEDGFSRPASSSRAARRRPPGPDRFRYPRQICFDRALACKLIICGSA
jgi:hypothetical protein